jgi:hypothetical protein
MEKAKFWLVQVVMVAFVSLIFGSPVMAHRDGGHKWSKWSSKSEYKAHKAEKRDKWLHKKMERNIKKYDRKVRNLKNKIASKGDKRSKRWMKYKNRKLNRYQKKLEWYTAKYEKHMAEKHGVVEEEPVPEPEPIVCAEGEVLEDGVCVAAGPTPGSPCTVSGMAGVYDENGMCVPSCNPFTGC